MSRANQYTGTKDLLYSDFLTDLNPHPVVKDIVRYVNENAVARSIRNLLLTNRGERLYQPTIGTDIRKLLFEPMSDSTAQLIVDYVRTTIQVHEPRAKVLSIEAVPNFDRNLYSVTISFYCINNQQPTTVNISLVRVR